MKAFADFLKELRVIRHLTQQQVYEGICSRREYQRYENDEAEPNIHVLRSLSIKLGYDFAGYYDYLANVNGEASVAKDKELLSAMSKKNEYDVMHDTISHLIQTHPYSLFANKKMLYFYDSIYYSDIKDYSESNRLSLMILHDEDPQVTVDNPCGAIFTEYGIYAVHTIAINHGRQGNEIKMGEILTQLIDLIESLDREGLSNYQNKDFRRNMHQTALYNLAISYNIHGNREEAERCIDRALSYAKEYDTIYKLAQISYQKAYYTYANHNQKDCMYYLRLSEAMCQFLSDDHTAARIKELRADIRNEWGEAVFLNS